MLHLVGGEVQTLVGTNTLDGEYSVSHDNGFALSLGAFPEATVGSFVVDPSAEVTPAEALHEQGALNAGWKVVIVLSSNVPGRILHVILQTLQTAHPDAAIIGGGVAAPRPTRSRNVRYTTDRRPRCVCCRYPTDRPSQPRGGTGDLMEHNERFW